MESSVRLVEQPVDRQTFPLAGRRERPSLGIDLHGPLRGQRGSRRRLKRPAPAAGRQRQAERQRKRADRGDTAYAVETAHRILTPDPSHTYNRWTAASERRSLGREHIRQLLLFSQLFQPLVGFP